MNGLMSCIEVVTAHTLLWPNQYRWNDWWGHLQNHNAWSDFGDIYEDVL